MKVASSSRKQASRQNAPLPSIASPFAPGASASGKPVKPPPGARPTRSSSAHSTLAIFSVRSSKAVKPRAPMSSTRRSRSLRNTSSTARPATAGPGWPSASSSSSARASSRSTALGGFISLALRGALGMQAANQARQTGRHQLRDGVPSRSRRCGHSRHYLCALPASAGIQRARPRPRSCTATSVCRTIPAIKKA